MRSEYLVRGWSFEIVDGHSEVIKFCHILALFSKLEVGVEKAFSSVVLVDPDVDR
jgi:hypothetical protein